MMTRIYKGTLAAMLLGTIGLGGCVYGHHDRDRDDEWRGRPAAYREHDEHWRDRDFDRDRHVDRDHDRDRDHDWR